MGTKFACLLLIILVASPVCCKWIRRVKTGMEDGKTIYFYERLFRDQLTTIGEGMCCPFSMSVKCPEKSGLCDYHNCNNGRGCAMGSMCCCSTTGWVDGCHPRSPLK